MDGFWPRDLYEAIRNLIDIARSEPNGYQFTEPDTHRRGALAAQLNYRLQRIDEMHAAIPEPITRDSKRRAAIQKAVDIAKQYAAAVIATPRHGDSRTCELQGALLESTSTIRLYTQTVYIREPHISYEAAGKEYNDARGNSDTSEAGRTVKKQLDKLGLPCTKSIVREIATQSRTYRKKTGVSPQPAIAVHPEPAPVVSPRAQPQPQKILPDVCDRAGTCSKCGTRDVKTYLVPGRGGEYCGECYIHLTKPDEYDAPRPRNNRAR